MSFYMRVLLRAMKLADELGLDGAVAFDKALEQENYENPMENP